MKKFIFALVLCLLSIELYANQVNFVLKGTWGDKFYGDVIYEDDKLYVASDGIIVFDVSIPSKLQKQAKIPINSNESIIKFEKIGDILFVLTKREFVTIDISSMGEPRLLSSITYQDGDGFIDYTMSNQQLFLLVREQPQVLTYDMSSLDTPIKTKTGIVSSEFGISRLINIALTKDYLFVGGLTTEYLLSLEDENFLSTIYSAARDGRANDFKSRAKSYDNVVYYFTPSNIFEMDFSDLNAVSYKVLKLEGDEVNPHYLSFDIIDDMLFVKKEYQLNRYSLKKDNYLSLLSSEFTPDLPNFALGQGITAFTSDSEVALYQDGQRLSRYSQSNIKNPKAIGDSLIANNDALLLFEFNENSFQLKDTIDDVFPFVHDQKMDVHSDYIYTGRGNIYQATEGYSLEYLDSFKEAYNGVYFFQVQDNKLIRQASNVLEIFDLTIPLTPQLMFSSPANICLDYCHHYSVKGNQVFGSSLKGLYYFVFDDSGTIIEQRYLSEGASSKTFIEGSYLFEPRENDSYGYDLNVWKLSNEGEPILVQTVENFLNWHNAYSQVKYKNWLIFDSFEKTSIIDISDPENAYVTKEIVKEVNNYDWFSLAVFQNNLMSSNEGQLTAYQINEAPKILTDTLTLDEDTQIVEPLTIENLENDALSFDIVEEPLNGIIEVTEGSELVYVPEENFFGEDAVKVKVTDQYGGYSEKQIAIIVNYINDAPKAISRDYSGHSGQVVSGQLNADDIDDDELTFTLVENVSYGSLTLNSDGSFSYQSSANYVGSDSFTFRVTDKSQALSEAKVTINVAEKPKTTSTESSNSSGGTSSPYILLLLWIVSTVRTRFFNLKNVR
ncbi:Ig-like domain-containing protein [Thalassotalea ganghwensis]